MKPAREKALGPDHPDVAQSLNSLAALSRATERETEAEVLEQRAEEPQEAAVKPPVQQPQHGAKPQRPKAANHREDSLPVAKPGQRAGKGPLPEPQDVGKPRQRTVRDRLQELLSIYELGLINEEEFAAKRKELLDSL